jgi:hypothetical protein
MSWKIENPYKFGAKCSERVNALSQAQEYVSDASPVRSLWPKRKKEKKSIDKDGAIFQYLINSVGSIGSIGRSYL